MPPVCQILGSLGAILTSSPKHTQGCWIYKDKHNLLPSTFLVLFAFYKSMHFVLLCLRKKYIHEAENMSWPGFRLALCWHPGPHVALECFHGRVKTWCRLRICNRGQQCPLEDLGYTVKVQPTSFGGSWDAQGFVSHEMGRT